jgi:alkylation response protein AidB-like acyl-CoA dehydrogenase
MPIIPNEERQTMSTSLTPEQQSIVEGARKLTQERLAPRAAMYDREAAHPTENWRDLWEHGLLAMSVPKQYGGRDLDTPTYIRVVEEVAGGCTNTAMTLHMHSTVQRFISALATHEQKAGLYPDVVERGRLFGSWGSEPDISPGRGFVMETSIEPCDGGYVINGVKHFCTMSGAASRYMVWCTFIDNARGSEDMAAGLLQALVPADSPGMRPISEWDTLGMRATVSPSMEFKDCFVSGDYVLGKPGDVPRLGLMGSFALGFAAVYLGAATAALDFTAEFCKTRTYRPNPLPISHEPMVQRHIGEMRAQLDAARLTLYDSASRWDEAGIQDRAVLAARAKYLCTEAALMVTSRAIQVTGGRSAHKAMPLERAFRDVRTSTLMPPNVEMVLATLGRDWLGLAVGQPEVPAEAGE